MSTQIQKIIPNGTKVIIQTLKGDRRTKAPQLEGKFAKIVSLHPSGTAYQVLVDMGDKVVDTHVACYRCHEHNHNVELNYKRLNGKVKLTKDVQPAPPAAPNLFPNAPAKESTYMIVINRDNGTKFIVEDGLKRDQVRDAVKKFLNQYGKGHTARVLEEVEAFTTRTVITKV